MALRRSRGFRRMLAVIAAVAVGVGLVGCSSGSSDDASGPDSPTEAPANGGSSGADEDGAEDGADEDGADEDGAEAGSDSANGESPVPPTTQPLLADEVLAGVTDLAAGEEVRDAGGNLITVHGVAAWPAPFDALSDQAREAFPFVADLADARNPEAQLVAFDVGMCAAGIDGVDGGTAEFFAHVAATDALSTDPVFDRGLHTAHPVLQPAFGFPDAAECERGWLPVLWSGDDTPAVARYVLAIRADGQGDIERHVYQWQLEPDPATSAQVDADADDEALAADGLARPGQTVTFTTGPIAETTVIVDGWTELVGRASEIDGTRVVSVSLELCPAGLQPPDFGLGVDGWNLIAPLDSQAFHDSVDDAIDGGTDGCFEGWLDFAVPFGAIPTAFFAADGQDGESGRAEWTLAGAAIAAPE